jgi:hypothetical protein
VQIDIEVDLHRAPCRSKPKEVAAFSYNLRGCLSGSRSAAISASNQGVEAAAGSLDFREQHRGV